MSLVDSEHIIPAKERHGARYKMFARKHDGVLVPGMIFRYGDPIMGEKMCPNCFRTPFSQETKICPRCGVSLEN